MKELEVKRGFKGVWIPRDIWLSKGLTLQEKVFLVEIESLDNENGCFASNSHFSNFFGLSRGRVSQVIKGLEEKNLITCEYVYNEDKSISKRVIRVVRKLKGGIKFSKGGYLGNDEGSNTLLSNTSNNKDIVEKLDNGYLEIIEYLNKKADTNYRHTTRKTKSLIDARQNEGFTIQDFKKVIDIKTAEWLDDEKMNKFIRPETLFSNKFESYLNQKEVRGNERSGRVYENGGINGVNF